MDCAAERFLVMSCFQDEAAKQQEIKKGDWNVE